MHRLLLLGLSVAAAAGCSASPRYHVYWGDVHTHTRLSDGRGSLDDLFTYARDDARLDFVIVTDHDFGNAHPWRMPKENWRAIHAKADAYTVAGRFVAIGGYEWTSQTKYWTEVGEDEASEQLFPGAPRFYNHKCAYFPGRVEYLFCAKDAAYKDPGALAEAVGACGGLIHNAHPDASPEGRDQFDYLPRHASVIANTEMGPDVMYYDDRTYVLDWERLMCGYLGRGGKTGFVGGTDTHEGRPAARTAVLARRLTRGAIFDALRHRRNYAVSGERILLDFRINGGCMGEEIAIEGKPRITVDVRGTQPIEEVAVVRNGAVVRLFHPRTERATIAYVDEAFAESAWYYVRVTQADRDTFGNPSRAWSSPIWVSRRR